MIEIFLPIINFEDRYEISNLGNVKSLERRTHQGRLMKEKLMKIHIHDTGYKVIWLRKPGVHQKFFIHRLIAIHFLDPIEGKDFVNHKNKDRADCSPDNLEWVSHVENCYHRDHYEDKAF